MRRLIHHPRLVPIGIVAAATLAGLALILFLANPRSSARHSQLRAVTAVIGPKGLVTPHHRSRVRPVGGSPAGLSVARPIFGEAASLGAAPSVVGFPVPQADAAEATPANLTNVLVNQAMKQVALVYGGGQLAVVMSPALYSDPITEFTDFVSSNDATASLGSVDGLAALVITPNTDEPQTNPAWVEFDLNGVDVSLESDTLGTSTLLTVADSLACDGCAVEANASVGHGADGIVKGRAVTCRSRRRSLACALARRSNVLVLTSKRQAVARAHTNTGIFKFTLPPGRYGIMAVAPTANKVMPTRRIRWVALHRAQVVGVRIRRSGRG
jgi:hypothetical protein